MGALLPMLLAGWMLSAAPAARGDTTVGLLLHDTCAGARAPVCSRLGRMFIPGFVTRSENKALRASKAYCELLGTPWECLDARSIDAAVVAHETNGRALTAGHRTGLIAHLLYDLYHALDLIGSRVVVHDYEHRC